MKTIRNAADIDAEFKCAKALGAAARAVGCGEASPVMTVPELKEYAYSKKKGKGVSTMMAVQALLFATTICALSVSSMIMNEGKLDDTERAWLWHWRWGHGDWNGPVKASEGLDPADVLTNVKLNVDSAVCDKAHFKRGSFPRNDPLDHNGDPPFWRVYVDGYRGQGSMGMESYEGAIGGFVFYDRSSKTLRNKLVCFP